VKTRYRLDGPAGAPVVVMAHALGATLELWDAQAAALAGRYRVLRYDVRGHGGSEVPPGPYTLEQMAGDLRELLDALGIADVHFVGLSMGGLIGMTFALAHPGRVRSLVLCDTTACYGPAVTPMWDDRLRVAETRGMTQELIDKTMAIWFTPEFHATHKSIVDGVSAMLRATDPRGYVAAIRAIGWVDLRDRLGAPADDPPRHAVVCACGEARVALAVDHVDGLGTIEAAPGNATLPGVPRLARAGDRFAVILAPGDLFGAAEQALLAAERVA